MSYTAHEDDIIAVRIMVSDWVDETSDPHARASQDELIHSIIQWGERFAAHRAAESESQS